MDKLRYQTLVDARRSVVALSTGLLVGSWASLGLAEDADAPPAGEPGPSLGQTEEPAPAPAEDEPVVVNDEAVSEPGSLPPPRTTRAPRRAPMRLEPPPKPPARDQRRREFRQRTWLGDGPIDHGGYGGALVRVSEMNDDTALFIGGRGGWLIDHHLILGGAGMAQALNLEAPAQAIAEEPEARNLEFAYGGFFVGYHLFPQHRIHGFASLLFAGGGLGLSDRSGDNDDAIDHDGDGVFVLEPELGLEANILKFMRMQFTLSYRQVWGVDLPGLDNQDVSGIAGGLALLFGEF